MRELEKISGTHKRGKFDIPEKDFLELVLCPYEGNGIMDKKPLKKYIREREEIERTLPGSKSHLKLAIDRTKYTQVAGITEEKDMAVKAHMSKKAQQEEKAKTKKEKQRVKLENHSHLADSILAEWQRRKYQGSYAEEDSLVGPNRRRTTHFANQIEYVHSDSEEEQDERQPDEGPRYQRQYARPIALPINISED